MIPKLLAIQTIIPKFLLGSHGTWCPGTCGGLRYLPKEQERFSFTNGTTTVITCSNEGMGRYIFRFHWWVAQLCRKGFNSSGGWSLNKICAFHCIAPSLLSLTEIMRLHGTPRSIVSDRDPIFMSTFWREFFKLQGTELRTSSAYHSQMDGQTEVINRCLEQYLRCFTSQHPKHWEQFLAWAEYWYNTTYHQSTGTTPFEALYDRLPPLLINYFSANSLVNEVDKTLGNRDEVLQALKQNLHKANNHMK